MTLYCIWLSTSIQHWVFWKDTYDDWYSCSDSSNLCILLHYFLDASLAMRMSWEVQWQSGRLQTMFIKLRKSRNTHGWKANIIFSLLSGHFELLNKRIRLTFWIILHFGVRSTICLPLTGSIEWEMNGERKNKGSSSSKVTPLSRAAWGL